MIYGLGVDPDTHHLAWSIVGIEYDRVNPKPLLIDFGTFEVERKKTGPEAECEMIRTMTRGIKMEDQTQQLLKEIKIVTVESQQVYVGKAFRANDLVRLAHVGGAAAQLFVLLCPQADLKMPLPRDWKGEVPKDIHQSRILRKLLDSPAKAKIDTLGVRRSHVIDSIGLAFWGVSMYVWSAQSTRPPEVKPRIYK